MSARVSRATLARSDPLFLGSNAAIARQPEKIQVVSYGRDCAGAATLFGWGGTQSENEGQSPIGDRRRSYQRH